MRVRVFQEIDGFEVLQGECDLTECFPDDPEMVADTADRLRERGSCWIGGGAAPLSLLMLVREGGAA